MATLYVTEPGSRIEREYRHLLVTKDDEVLLRVPLGQVSDVVLVGRGVGATTPALHALLGAGIGLSLVSRTGELLGRLAPPSGKNLDLRRRQYARGGEPEFCLAFARQVVMGKLRNYHTFALRWRRARPELPEEAVGRIAGAVEKAGCAPDMAALRGIEGAASKAYFSLMRRHMAPEFSFERRSRRPPRDPANVLLSLGYTLLGEAITTALEVVGLDPYAGFYHADRYGRPALALDLLEEFRAPIVDSAVLTTINKRMLGMEDFEEVDREGEHGVYLGRRGLDRFLRQFTSRLQAPFTHPLAGRRISYQKCLEVQARLAAKTITGEAPAYRPCRVR